MLETAEELCHGLHRQDGALGRSQPRCFVVERLLNDPVELVVVLVAHAASTAGTRTPDRGHTDARSEARRNRLAIGHTCVHGEMAGASSRERPLPRAASPRGSRSIGAGLVPSR